MISHTVTVRIDDRYKTQVEPEVLRKSAEATLDQQRVDEAYDLTIVVTGDQVLRELNRRHRGLDRSTDVLAFPNETKGPFVDVPAFPRYLGDVIISFPQAKTQALEAGNDLSAELQLLVVHGVLHLLGYDDQTQPERTRMWRAQQAVLDELVVEVHLTD